jgi:signal transduction histidine kinase
MLANDRVNILMVDDQPAKLLSYEVILSELGENLLKASSGREALEQLLKSEVAVVLMDVSMPDLDGFQLADMIREHPRFQKTAIIFISAVHLTDVDRVKGYQRGAVDYISVPVVPELLRAKVSVFAELHRKTQQLENLNRELELRVAQRTEALVRSEKLAAMGRLAGIIAHEINNPLEAISNALFLLREHPSLDNEARRFLSLAEQELTRVAHITKQTLSFYRESQEPVSVSIFEVLDNVLELQSHRLRASGIKLDKEFRSSLAIQGYPNELKQVFLNLIGNAIEAMREGGRLRIRVDEQTEPRTGRRGVRVSVCDTGSGIDSRHEKRIFEPFFTTKDAKGTGLGLWISRGIVEKYDGTIRFRSLHSASGQTTCFSVFIPSTPAPSSVGFSVSAVAG